VDNITIKTSIDDDIIVLNFSSGEKVNITTNGDVELSEYVYLLTKIIDRKQQLTFQKFEFNDSKYNLIQDILENITKSFNASVFSEDQKIGQDSE